MKCKDVEKLLSPYLEQDLNAEEKKTVEEHLAACQKCAPLLTLMQKTLTCLKTIPEMDLRGNLLNRLYEIPEKTKRFRWDIGFLLRPSLQPVLAAATVFLTLISFYAFNPNRSDINKSISRQLHIGYSEVEKLYAKAESFSDTLIGYKENVLVSLKNMNPLDRNGG